MRLPKRELTKTLLRVWQGSEENLLFFFVVHQRMYRYIQELHLSLEKKLNLA